MSPKLVETFQIDFYPRIVSVDYNPLYGHTIPLPTSPPSPLLKSYGVGVLDYASPLIYRYHSLPPSSPGYGLVEESITSAWSSTGSRPHPYVNTADMHGSSLSPPSPRSTGPREVTSALNYARGAEKTKGEETGGKLARYCKGEGRGDEGEHMMWDVWYR
ncbi:hypothetical protein TrRE_jg13207 [Triparma retinervis]|uniref:Uncharacterized protein n=1 Tax=Triparma retinervis TaxID=2557542 RepID=A0A9W7E5P8_9STRA|nr:hypothetical protein TrRE_jg13207 [Triparma retinervis]